MISHPDLSSGRWHKMSLAEQLGNVGSEYDRASKWRREKNESRFNSALQRFLELLDLTINDPRWSLPRKRELLRLRETACAELLGETSGTFKKYFYNFALMAQRNKNVYTSIGIQKI